MAFRNTQGDFCAHVAQWCFFHRIVHLCRGIAGNGADDSEQRLGIQHDLAGTARHDGREHHVADGARRHARRDRRHRHPAEPAQRAEHQAQFGHGRRRHHRAGYRRSPRPLGDRGAAARSRRRDEPLRRRQRSRPLFGRRIGHRHPRPDLHALRVQRPRHFLHRRLWAGDQLPGRARRAARLGRGIQGRHRRPDRGRPLRHRQHEPSPAVRQQRLARRLSISRPTMATFARSGRRSARCWSATRGTRASAASAFSPRAPIRACSAGPTLCRFPTSRRATGSMLRRPPPPVLEPAATNCRPTPIRKASQPSFPALRSALPATVRRRAAPTALPIWANVRYAPIGGQFRIQEFDRKRRGIAGGFQWQSLDRRALLTAQFLNSRATEDENEHVYQTGSDLQLVQYLSAWLSWQQRWGRQFAGRPVPGGEFTNYSYDGNGVFQNGYITLPPTTICIAATIFAARRI